MFDKLSESFTNVLSKLGRRNVVNQSDLNSVLSEIRLVLLDGDVSPVVIEYLIDKINKNINGHSVIKSLSKDQVIIKAVHEEMVAILSSGDCVAGRDVDACGSSFVTDKDKCDGKSGDNKSDKSGADARSKGGDVVGADVSQGKVQRIFLVGLQVSGKTTHAAKLALKLKKVGKNVLLVSLDTYRPAAQEQLAKLAEINEIDSFPIRLDKTPIEIAKEVVTNIKGKEYDVIIYDTAGRLHVDDKMISELVELKGVIRPTDTYLVLDSMMGQSVTDVATTFNDKIYVTGLILSRVDGDAKGGAILNLCYFIKKKILFLGIGEKASDIQDFFSETIASRILGMGDIVALVRKAEETFDKDETDRISKRMREGKFTLNDYLSQMLMIGKMGGMTNILKFLPGGSSLMNKLGSTPLEANKMKISIAIIRSMNKKERRDPAILNVSRNQRIAKGAGVNVSDVTKLVKSHAEMQKAIKQLSRMDPELIARRFKLFS